MRVVGVEYCTVVVRDDDFLGNSSERGRGKTVNEKCKFIEESVSEN